jgi:Fe-S oxidoreductase
MCNNNGHCRKFDVGTMCPSYRVTRDEQHSTRGRANTLRLVLSGQLAGEDLAGDAVHEALDLCVSCKGCRRECPTGVDMAKLKIEARAARAARRGIALGERLVAYLPRYAPLIARMSWLPALRDRVPGVARLSERALGLSTRRSLPRWQGDFLRSRAPSVAAASSDSKQVVLFVDSFTNYFAHENAIAATTVLERAGYVVHTNAVGGERPLCCGRTFLAAGLVGEAKVEARRTVDALLPWLERGVSVVGLEPSCLLGMRDEFLDYGFGNGARALAANAWLFEEFLVREKEVGRFAMLFPNAPAHEAIAHAHCHQKALGGAGAMTEVLRWIPGMSTRLIDSSCCGMAGAFGYETAHYATSMAMGELALLPAARAAAPETLVIADGFSCSHQIRDGSGREAIHVARVLAQAMESRP